MTNYKRYPTSWQLEPTVRQLDTIIRLCHEMGIPEPKPAPTTRWEARRRIYELNKRRT